MPSRPVRVVTQGPSDPVRVVTQGIADPVRIISGTPSDPVRVVTSGISTPIRVVAGSIPTPTPTLPDVASATLILDLQIDVLVLSDNDPVGTWADASGQGHDFTQTGAARPIYHANDNGYPSIETSFVPPRWMLGSNFGGELTSWLILSVCKAEFLGTILSKVPLAGWPGWMLTNGNASDYDPNGSNSLVINCSLIDPNLFNVISGERISDSEMHFYLNGSEAGNDDWSNSPSAPADDPLTPVTLCSWQNTNQTVARVRSVMMYVPAPNASDRAAIEGWLAARYGITL